MAGCACDTDPIYFGGAFSPFSFCASQKLYGTSEYKPTGFNCSGALPLFIPCRVRSAGETRPPLRVCAICRVPTVRAELSGVGRAGGPTAGPRGVANKACYMCMSHAHVNSSSVPWTRMMG